MSKELDRIICPFCGVDQELEFMYTNPEFHEIECCNCYQPFTYKLTEFDWEAYDSYEDIRKGDKSYGHSITSPPPAYLDEYAIPSFKCLTEHWTILKNWKRMNWVERLDWFILRLPVWFRKWYFENTYEWERW